MIAGAAGGWWERRATRSVGFAYFAPLCALPSLSLTDFAYKTPKTHRYKETLKYPTQHLLITTLFHFHYLTRLNI
ncbi:hypothetical protein L2E82_18358 [Cichorium intybus]|uniref:Uncharacterized protein n=1 Tax=Cichorium intybus TaxID=13427 RepID=A0ACB9F9Y5_CICIN|nr:hypothetical protein L2E82_18358 [Cichorium intybus]